MVPAVSRPATRSCSLKNDAALGVKNGMIAHVVEARPGWLKAMVGEGEHRRHVDVDQRFYANLDHGYATTIHKSQGATVDRVKVLATLSLDRHLSYVALTRHREDVGLYYGALSFGRPAAWRRSCRSIGARKPRSTMSAPSYPRRPALH